MRNINAYVYVEVLDMGFLSSIKTNTVKHKKYLKKKNPLRLKINADMFFVVVFFYKT